VVKLGNKYSLYGEKQQVVGRRHGKRPLEGPNSKWKDSIKMNLRNVVTM